MASAASTQRSLPGLDVPALQRYLSEELGLGEVERIELIAGGRSNLTYGVAGEGFDLVLRRPPLGHVLATAHDMGREHRFLQALAGTVPVPEPVAHCADEQVLGAPFYLMARVDGVVLRSADDLAGVDPGSATAALEALVDVLAGLHAVDPAAVGLTDVGRPEGFVARQVRRWTQQWHASTTRDGALFDAVAERLAAAVPDGHEAAIVHGDYRLDNCLLRPDGTIAAVLDWELCTLGDPLADVGLLCVYWTDPDDGTAALLDAATTLEGFPTKAEVVERYARASGRDVSDIGYYVALGYWKLACILEGVYARYKGGVMGESSGYEGFARQVEVLAEAARATLEELGT